MEEDLMVLIQLSSFYGGKIFKEGLTEIIIPRMFGITKKTEKFVNDLYFFFNDEENSLNFLKLIEKRNSINSKLKKLPFFQKNDDGYFIQYNERFICHSVCKMNINWCIIEENKLFYYNNYTSIYHTNKISLEEYLKKGIFMFKGIVEKNINYMVHEILYHKYNINPLLIDFLEREVRSEYVADLLRNLLFYFLGNSKPIFYVNEKKETSIIVYCDNFNSMNQSNVNFCYCSDIDFSYRNENEGNEGCKEIENDDYNMIDSFNNCIEYDDYNMRDFLDNNDGGNESNGGNESDKEDRSNGGNESDEDGISNGCNESDKGNGSDASDANYTRGENDIRNIRNENNNLNSNFKFIERKKLEIPLSDGILPDHFQNYVYYDFITKKKFNVNEWKNLKQKPVFWKKILIPEDEEEIIWVINFIQMKKEKYFESEEQEQEQETLFHRRKYWERRGCWGCLENSLAQIDHCGVNGCLSV